MRKRQKRSIGWVVALLLGVAATSGYADTSVDKKKGKAGDACKIDDDCDQAARPQRCRESKCEARPVHPVTLRQRSSATHAIGDLATKKGKPGDACKSSNDCDQASQPQVCRDKKCQVEAPPPPT